MLRDIWLISLHGCSFCGLYPSSSHYTLIRSYLSTMDEIPEIKIFHAWNTTDNVFFVIFARKWKKHNYDCQKSLESIHSHAERNMENHFLYLLSGNTICFYRILYTYRHVNVRSKWQGNWYHTDCIFLHRRCLCHRKNILHHFLLAEKTQPPRCRWSQCT